MKSIYDADTIRVDIDLGFRTWKVNEQLRLARINAPEVRGEEKEKGIAARNALRELIDGKEIRIETEKTGKYGRYIAEIEFEGKNINDWLVESGHAKYKDY